MLEFYEGELSTRAEVGAYPKGYMNSNLKMSGEGIDLLVVASRCLTSLILLGPKYFQPFDLYSHNVKRHYQTGTDLLIRIKMRSYTKFFLVIIPFISLRKKWLLLSSKIKTLNGTT